MKNGMFNDAVCYLTHTGPRRDQIGMGYICERHRNGEIGFLRTQELANSRGRFNLNHSRFGQKFFRTNIVLNWSL